MFNKASIVRFFAVVVVIFSISAHVSADVQLKGPETKQIVVDKEALDYKMDYTKTYAFYNTTDKDQKQYYTLNIGKCKLEFFAGRCSKAEVNYRDQNVKKDNGADGSDDIDWKAHHDDLANGTVKPSSISFHAHDFLFDSDINYNYPCTAQFDNSLIPGRYVINVSLSGADVAPDLIVNFIGAELFDTSMIPADAPAPKKLEVWQISLIVAGSVIILLAVIGLCIAVICCYRKKKANDKKVVESEHSTAASTMGTTVGAFTNRETEVYGSDMMHISKNITEGGPNTLNSQAVSPAPQATSPAPQATSPAPTASPMPQ